MKLDTVSKICFFCLLAVCVSCSSVDGEARRFRQEQEVFRLYIRDPDFAVYPKYQVGNLPVEHMLPKEAPIAVREEIINAFADSVPYLSQEELEYLRKPKLEGWGRLLRCDDYLGVFRSRSFGFEFLVCNIKTGNVYHVRLSSMR